MGLPTARPPGSADRVAGCGCTGDFSDFAAFTLEMEVADLSGLGYHRLHPLCRAPTRNAPYGRPPVGRRFDGGRRMSALSPRPFAAVTTLALLTLFLAAGNGHAQITFTNNSGITIPPVGTATPYPSTITVSGYTGTVTNITVTLTGFSHSYTDDLGAVVTGPAGQKTILFDGPGVDVDPGTSVSNINLTFADSAAARLPNNADFGSGTYQPGQNQWGDLFSAPAPAAPYATNFSAFTGVAPDGVYALYVQD